MSDTPTPPPYSPPNDAQPGERCPLAGEQADAPDAPQSTSDDARRPWLRLLLPLAGMAAILLVLALLLMGQGSNNDKLPNNAKRSSSSTFAGGTLTPLRPAPPIDLKNYLGQRVTIGQYRGKVVLVTFLYTHCPDVCPLIATNLHAAQTRLGAAARNVRIISVSVDPRGDTPKTVADFLRVHDMTGRMQYLLGSAKQLGRTWKAWNVGSEKDASSPEFVAHSALVYGISASGKLTTVYPANFKPADIAHDVPLLAKR
jgi:protein SCO1/2